MDKISIPLVLFCSMCTLDAHTPGNNSRELIFDQTSTMQQTFISCQWDSIWPFWTRVADNFSVSYAVSIDSLVWWGGYWQGPPSMPSDFWIEFYPDSTGFNQPKNDSMYSERVSFTETNITDEYCQYDALIPPFLAEANEVYWIVFRASLPVLPMWGNNCSSPPDWGDGQELYFKDDGIFGHLAWTPATVAFDDPFESSFQIYGTAVGVEEGNEGVHGSEYVSINTLANDRIELKITLPASARVLARIFDLTGRAVTTVLDSQLPAGVSVHEYRGDLSCGVYFVEVITSGHREIKKVLVVR